jgi:hypothetical protein
MAKTPDPLARLHYLGVLEALHKRCRRPELKTLKSALLARIRYADPERAIEKLRISFWGGRAKNAQRQLKMTEGKIQSYEARLIDEIEGTLGLKIRNRGVAARPGHPA